MTVRAATPSLYAGHARRPSQRHSPPPEARSAALQRVPLGPPWAALTAARRGGRRRPRAGGRRRRRSRQTLAPQALGDRRAAPRHVAPRAQVGGDRDRLVAAAVARAVHDQRREAVELAPRQREV